MKRVAHILHHVFDILSSWLMHYRIRCAPQGPLCYVFAMGPLGGELDKRPFLPLG